MKSQNSSDSCSALYNLQLSTPLTCSDSKYQSILQDKELAKSRVDSLLFSQGLVGNAEIKATRMAEIDAQYDPQLASCKSLQTYNTNSMQEYEQCKIKQSNSQAELLRLQREAQSTDDEINGILRIAKCTNYLKGDFLSSVYSRKNMTAYSLNQCVCGDGYENIAGKCTGGIEVKKQTIPANCTNGLYSLGGEYCSWSHDDIDKICKNSFGTGGIVVGINNAEAVCGCDTGYKQTDNYKCTKTTSTETDLGRYADLIPKSIFKSEKLGFSIKYPTVWKKIETDSSVSFTIPISNDQAQYVLKLQADINLLSGTCAFPNVIIKDRGNLDVGTQRLKMITMANTVQGRNYFNRMYSLQKDTICYFFTFTTVTASPSSKGYTGTDAQKISSSNKALVDIDDSQFTNMIKSFVFITSSQEADENKVVSDSPIPTTTPTIIEIPTTQTDIITTSKILKRISVFEKLSGWFSKLFR